MKKKNSPEPCLHEWRKSYEERVMFDDGVGEHTGVQPKWTCKKCGKVSYTEPV